MRRHAFTAITSKKTNSPVYVHHKRIQTHSREQGKNCLLVLPASEEELYSLKATREATSMDKGRDMKQSGSNRDEQIQQNKVLLFKMDMKSHCHLFYVDKSSECLLFYVDSGNLCKTMDTLTFEGC